MICSPPSHNFHPLGLTVFSGENACSTTVCLVITSLSHVLTSRLNRHFHYFSQACLPDPSAAHELLLSALHFVITWMP